MEKSPYLSTKEAAQYLRLSKRTLERYRLEGCGPLFHVIGRRRVYYALADLTLWTEQQRAQSTAEVAVRRDNKRHSGSDHG